ncbi:MAG: hypothetical protein LBH69_01115 [Methanomassiliicoccaceae archaeon]|jgi:hypothetical protein|nr:hypothetical protein [Methanomassiliicoccaceae archaeon]
MWFRRKEPKELGDRPCPCCGKLVFMEKEKGMCFICEFCSWEDEYIEGPDEFSDCNYMSLNGCKKEYSLIISADPSYIWGRSFNRTRTKYIDPLQKIKDAIKQEYKEIFEIVKQSIDKWDCMGFLDYRIDDVYDLQTIEIVPIVSRIDGAEELTDHIIKIFAEYFGTGYESERAEAKKVAEEILYAKSKTN